MLICPNCNAIQPDDAAFCDQCGAALGGIASGTFPPPPVAFPAASAAPGVTACPSCGAPVLPGQAFCGQCGTLLAGIGAAWPTPEPVPGAVLTPVAPPPPPTPEVLPGELLPSPPAVGGLQCPQCGAPLEPGSAFCDMCGAPVAGIQPPPPPPTPPVYPSPLPTPPVYPSPPSFPSPTPVPGRLIVRDTNAVLPFPPNKSEILIGREDPVNNIFPDMDLTDHGGDRGGVSRRHARIFTQGDQVFIEDLNSTNYTYVNQQKLVPGQPHPLRDGDEIRLGKILLIYLNP